MKSDSNTEMELLLRRHARRSDTLAHIASDAASRNNEAATGDKHPDADEMNAYAEGELPSVARAHMIAHLADCDRCRALVTTLTLAANLPVKEPETDARQSASPQRSWREWLAKLFAPPVIRYGVPALVMLCVVGVVFLALREREAQRQSNEPTFVARNNDQREGQTTSAVKPEASPPPLANSASPASRPGEEQPAPAQSKSVETAQTPADTPSLAKTKDVNKEENAETPQGAARAGAPASAAPITSDESSRQEAARDKRDEDLAANEPRPAAPPAAISQPSIAGRPQQQTEADRLSQNRKDSGPSDDRPATAGIISNTATREAEEKTTSTGATARSTEARRRPARKPETMVDGADASGAGGRSTETRSVGGRNFRRQGSAWVDTAYATGRATTNVTRGSEQYRALVADEPGLRTIADQLGGEVIVVWKSRAYRIH
jgi:Putative zinc-finger